MIGTGTIYVNGTATGTVTSTDGTITLPVGVDVGNGDSVTFSYTYTTNSGEWWMPDIDMTNWPPDDIIDHFALDLARRRPA